MRENEDQKIKIFVSMHDDFYVPNNKLLYPIQVGSSIADKRMENMLHDDEGDNISEKNRMYCELTAQYWVWKNEPELDYYGFFHYRRYLSFNPVQLTHYENIVYFDYCNERALKDIMLNENVMKKFISQYDVIYPQENPIGGDTIYEHWMKHLEKRDIDLLLEIIMEKYPEFYGVTKEVMNSKQAIHCNMFIMKKEYFMDYSQWLFDILAEHEKRADFSGYSTEKYRTIGHLAERLCAIYGKYLEAKGAKICYVQRTLFKNTEKSRTLKIQNEENFVPLILACNNKYVKYTGVLIESILRNSSEENRYGIYILNEDITEENQKILKEQVSAKANFDIEFINIRQKLSEVGTLFVDRHLSVETYFRFFSLDIFPQLDKALYLDCDMVAEADVAQLFQIDMEDKSIGATLDADVISLYSKECEADPEVRENIDNNIGLTDFTKYFQAGVLLLNLKKIRETYRSADFFDIARSRSWKFQDQDTLNYLFKGDVKYLDQSWNTLYECFNRMERIKKYAPKDIYEEYSKAKKSPKIIHFAGTPKPWQNMEADCSLYFWKYAKTSPFFEILLHDMNIKMFNEMKEKKGLVNAAEYLKLEEEAEDLRWRLDETRKSFSYRLGLKLTYLPRKLRRKKTD